LGTEHNNLIMKLFLLSSALLATLVAATDCSNTVCQDYAVHAGTTITFADGVTGVTTISGDLGVSPGTSITGVELGYMEFTSGEVASSADAADFAAGVTAALAAALATSGPTIADMSGQTYTPGTYTGAAAISIGGAGTFVTLDGKGDENAVFLFQAGTTLTTAANTYFNLINGAKAENVLFALGSSATLGANSVLEGSLIVGVSVTVGIDAQVNGCIIAKAAVTYSGKGGTTGASALTFDDSGTVLEHCVEVGAPTAAPTTSAPTAADTDCLDTASTLCQDYAVHAGTTITFADGVSAKTKISGDLGVSPGTSITGVNEGFMEFTSGEVASTLDAAAFANGVNAAHAAALATSGTVILEMSGQTYTPGTYTGAVDISISGAGTSVTLDGKGDENAVFLFQAGISMTTAANTYFNLINGAKAENVLFALGTSATLGEDSVLEGSLIVGVSVTVGLGAQVNGCIIAKAAVTYAGRGGTTGASALTFDDSGTVLEHCDEVGSPTSSPSAMPASSSQAQTSAPAPSPTSSRGDPHCKYQRFRFILFPCRSFILLSCRIFDLQSGPGRTSTLNTTDSATWFSPKIQSLLMVLGWTFTSEQSLFVSGVTSSKPLSTLGMTFSKLKVLPILQIWKPITGSTWNTKEDSRHSVVSQ
jgi:hypothetical protein